MAETEKEAPLSLSIINTLIAMYPGIETKVYTGQSVSQSVGWVGG